MTAIANSCMGQNRDVVLVVGWTPPCYKQLARNKCLIFNEITNAVLSSETKEVNFSVYLVEVRC